MFYSLVAKMSSKEIDDKKRLAALAANIREKYKRFRYGEAAYEKEMERTFKPLLKMRQTIAQPESSASMSSSTLPQPSLPQHSAESLTSEDGVFGLKRTKDGAYYLGEYKVGLSGDIISVHDRQYPATKGLLSLLTKKVPIDYSNNDVEHYKQMLVDTQAHLRKSDKQIKLTGGVKSSFVKRLFAATNDTRPSNLNFSLATKFFEDMSVNDRQLERLLSRRKRPLEIDKGEEEEEEAQVGEGISWIKHIKDSDNIKKSYTYWDDPNELVDRLVLLHASQKAGNNNVSSEISSIESELREAGYIL